MNTLEVGKLVEQALNEIVNTGVNLDVTLYGPDDGNGEHRVVAIIGKRKFEITINEVSEGK